MANNEVSRLKFNDTTYEIADELARESVGTALAEVASVEAKADGYNTALSGRITNLENSSGAVLVAKTRTAMTDTNKIYVYTGTTTTASGVTYTKGHWYYHNGSKWTDGGAYNQNLDAIDATLTQSNKGADAKVTGDRLTAAETDISTLRGTIANEYAIQTYAVGDYCYHSGLLYRCNTEISVGEEWTSSHWTAVDVMPELNNLKNDIKETDERLSNEEGYINYGYDYDLNLLPNPSASSAVTMGVVRHNTFITLNGTTAGSTDEYKTRIMLNGIGVRSRSDTTIIDATSVIKGANLITGHVYECKIEILQGDLNGADILPEVYRKGEATNSGYRGRFDGCTFGKFAAENIEYYFCLAITGGASFNNLSLRFTVQDLTESSKKYVETYENIIKLNNLVNYAGNSYRDTLYIRQQDPSINTTSLGVSRCRNVIQIKGHSYTSNYSKIKMNGSMERADNASTFIDDALKLEIGHTYEAKYIVLENGMSTNVPEVLTISVYRPGETRTVGTYTSTTTSYIRTFTADQESYQLILYTLKNIEFDAKILLLLQDITHSKSPNSIPSYYLEEYQDTIEKVRKCNNQPSLVFPIITDCHRYVASVQNFDNMVSTISKLSGDVKLDFLVNLGDTIQGDKEQSVSLEQGYACQNQLREIGLDYIYSEGNHDTNPYIQSESLVFSLEQIYSLWYSCYKKVKSNLSENGMDYYFDIDDIGVRVVSINSSNNNDTGSNTYAYGKSTATWLNSALNTQNKILLFTHVSPISTQVWNNNNPKNSSQVLQSIVSKVNESKSIIQISGHSHVDISFIDPYISLMMVCQKFEQADISTEKYQKISGYIDSLRNPERVKGTETEDAITIAIYKPNINEIDLIRFGAGTDRYFHCNPTSETAYTTILEGTVSWSTSDISVAQVSNGHLTEVGAGKCAIIAKDVTGNIEVWVYKNT